MLQDLTDEEEILRRAFQFFDKDGNGEISVPELRTTMHELGDLLSEEEIHAFMAVMDVNNDGVIGVSPCGRGRCVCSSGWPCIYEWIFMRNALPSCPPAVPRVHRHTKNTDAGAHPSPRPRLPAQRWRAASL